MKVSEKRMIFRQKAMLRTAIRPKRKVVAGRTLRNGVARRGYCGVPVNDFRASFPLPGMTLSVVLGRTPWRATRGSCTDCREYMPYRRLSARGRRRMCRRPQAGRCSPPHRAAAGCRSSATAENAYFLTESGCESVGNIPTFREFPARKSLPSFGDKSTTAIYKKQIKV